MSKNYFSYVEMECHCGCGESNMSPHFMDALNALREDYGKPISPSSAFRCLEYNRSIGGGPAHPNGVGADIPCHGQDALQIVALAGKHGFTGIGVKQHGNKRFIHIDMLPAGTYITSPRPWIWSYK